MDVRIPFVHIRDTRRTHRLGGKGRRSRAEDCGCTRHAGARGDGRLRDGSRSRLGCRRDKRSLDDSREPLPQRRSLMFLIRSALLAALLFRCMTSARTDERPIVCDCSQADMLSLSLDMRLAWSLAACASQREWSTIICRPSCELDARTCCREGRRDGGRLTK